MRVELKARIQEQNHFWIKGFIENRRKSQFSCGHLPLFAVKQWRRCFKHCYCGPNTTVTAALATPATAEAFSSHL